MGGRNPEINWMSRMNGEMEVTGSLSRPCLEHASEKCGGWEGKPACKNLECMVGV